MHDAAADVVHRVRRRSARWWAGEVAGGTRADAVAGLVAALAAYEQAVEIGTGPRPAAYRRPPRPAYPDAYASQLAVVAGDLVRALRAAPPGSRARHPDAGVSVETLAACALADLLVTAYAVDPRPLPEDAAAAALDRLYPGSTGDAAFGDLLLALERGPAVRDLGA